MGSVYQKRGKLWARFKNELGKWRDAPTPYVPGQEKLAQRYVDQRERKIRAVVEAGAQLGVPAGQPLTAAEYAEKWLKAREPLGLASTSDDETRLRRHVLPKIGAMTLEEVRPRHIRDLVMDLRSAKLLAPRTIHHVFHVTKAMFHHAVADELLDANPCVIPKGTLPKKVDKDPEWRAQAIYERPEVEQLISDPRIPEDRRVLYALKAIGGLRHGEAAGLTWRQYDATLEPLGALTLERTKTQVPRRVPVHPTLARVLAEWKLSGWERTYGRAPTAQDLVTPTRNLTPRDKHEAPKQLAADLELLKMRPRRGHDLRRTFITLAQVDGAARHFLEAVTHGPRGDIMNVYTSFPWPALCAEVAKLRISLREGLVLDGDFRTLAASLAATHRKGRNRWKKTVTPPGIEPGIAP